MQQQGASDASIPAFHHQPSATAAHDVGTGVTSAAHSARRLGLVLHPGRDCSAPVETVVAWARSHGAQVLARPEDAARCPEGVQAAAPEELAATVNAIVSLGGDGTMLGALRLAAARPVPVLGVNLGDLGFLVEVGQDELPAALDRLDSGDFTIEFHHGLEVGGPRGSWVAFNDVALARVPGEGAVRAALSISGRGHGRYRADAVIVATPLGSSAYSYAAGGPLVSPALEAVVISAAAPMSGISRALVVSADEPLRLEVLPRSGPPALEIDGSVHGRIAPGEHIDLRLRPDAAKVVRLDSDRYQRRNQVKLSLLDLPFLPDELRPVASSPPGHHHDADQRPRA
jgi:NAD+ kinase